MGGGGGVTRSDDGYFVGRTGDVGMIGAFGEDEGGERWGEVGASRGAMTGTL
jgi:hypothetical protein